MRGGRTLLLCIVNLLRVTMAIQTVVFIRVAESGKEVHTFLGTGITGYTHEFGPSLKVKSADIVTSTTVFKKCQAIRDYLNESSDENSNINVEIYIQVPIDSKWRMLINITKSRFKFKLLSSNHFTIYYESSQEVSDESFKVDISKAKEKLVKPVPHDIWITVGKQSEKWNSAGRRNGKLISHINTLNADSFQENTPIIQLTFDNSDEENHYTKMLKEGNTVFFFAYQEDKLEDSNWHRMTIISNIFVNIEKKSVNFEIYIRPKQIQLVIKVHRMIKEQGEYRLCEGKIRIFAFIQENVQKITGLVEDYPSHYFQRSDDESYTLVGPPVKWTYLESGKGWTESAKILLLDGSQAKHKIWISKITFVHGQEDVYPSTFEIDFHWL